MSDFDGADRFTSLTETLASRWKEMAGSTCRKCGLPVTEYCLLQLASGDNVFINARGEWPRFSAWKDVEDYLKEHPGSSLYYILDLNAEVMTFIHSYVVWTRQNPSREYHAPDFQKAP